MRRKAGEVGQIWSVTARLIWLRGNKTNKLYARSHRSKGTRVAWQLSCGSGRDGGDALRVCGVGGWNRGFKNANSQRTLLPFIIQFWTQRAGCWDRRNFSSKRHLHLRLQVTLSSLLSSFIRRFRLTVAVISHCAFFLPCSPLFSDASYCGILIRMLLLSQVYAICFDYGIIRICWVV